MAGGGELLIVDASDRDREGLRELFDRRGFVCSTASSRAQARDLLTTKFFPVALIDLDVDWPSGGLELARFVGRTSKPTAVVLTTDRESFEDAVGALRAGVLDVCMKSPSQLEHLTGVVERASQRVQATEGDGELLEEVRGVLDESFKVMLGLSRKVYSHLSLANVPLKPSILVVDGDQEFLRQLSELIQDKDWIISGEMNGGAALDRGMSAPVHVIASRAELMDLRGSMVIRSIQAQAADVIGLLYSSEGGGKIEQLEQGQVVDSELEFGGPAHLVKRIDAVVESLGTRAEERRFIQAFSADHRSFLRRYADLKLKIDRLLSR